MSEVAVIYINAKDLKEPGDKIANPKLVVKMLEERAHQIGINFDKSSFKEQDFKFLVRKTKNYPNIFLSVDKKEF